MEGTASCCLPQACASKKGWAGPEAAAEASSRASWKGARGALGPVGAPEGEISPLGLKPAMMPGPQGSQAPFRPRLLKQGPSEASPAPLWALGFSILRPGWDNNLCHGQA